MEVCKLFVKMIDSQYRYGFKVVFLGQKSPTLLSFCVCKNVVSAGARAVK